MPKLVLKDMSPVQAGRVNVQLDKLYRLHCGAIVSLRDRLEALESLVFDTCNAVNLEYNRTTFNRLDHAGQKEYMRRLEAKKLYFISDIKVPKIVYDALAARVADLEAAQ